MNRRPRGMVSLTVVWAALALLLASSNRAYGQRPYAPKAPVPDAAAADAFLAMEIRSVESAVVPIRSEVEAPPYPGAVIIRTTPSVERTREGTTFETLPVIVLVTLDSIDVVIAFYKERLPRWMHAEMLSTNYFWLGNEEFHPFARSGLTTPSLEVREARLSKLLPDARTEIHVRYKPGGGIRNGGRTRGSLLPDRRRGPSEDYGAGVGRQPRQRPTARIDSSG